MWVLHLSLKKLLAGDGLADERRGRTADQRACEAAFDDWADGRSARGIKGCSLEEHGGSMAAIVLVVLVVRLRSNLGAELERR